MQNKVKPIPERYGSVTPYLILSDAARAVEFYKKAFGAVEEMRMDMPNGKSATRKSASAIRSSCSPMNAQRWMRAVRKPSAVRRS
jgi:uncharacterized glyoxalase superfamily protein PhnB